MCLSWSGPVLHRAACNLGPLTVVAPLLEQMDVAAIIDRHLPPDPQLEFSHGRVLRLFLAARLSQPLALVNIPDWAEESGAEYLGASPPTNSTTTASVALSMPFSPSVTPFSPAWRPTSSTRFVCP